MLSELSQNALRIKLSDIGPFESFFAILIVSSSRLISSQTLLINPHSSAFSELSLSPKIANSFALAFPTSLGSSQVEPPSGTRPILLKACRKKADLEAITKSPINAKDIPTPAAAPFTDVTIGVLRFLNLRNIGWYLVSRA